MALSSPAALVHSAHVEGFDPGDNGGRYVAMIRVPDYLLQRLLDDPSPSLEFEENMCQCALHTADEVFGIKMLPEGVDDLKSLGLHETRNSLRMLGPVQARMTVERNMQDADRKRVRENTDRAEVARRQRPLIQLDVDEEEQRRRPQLPVESHRRHHMGASAAQEGRSPGQQQGACSQASAQTPPPGGALPPNSRYAALVKRVSRGAARILAHKTWPYRNRVRSVRMVTHAGQRAPYIRHELGRPLSRAALLPSARRDTGVRLRECDGLAHAVCALRPPLDANRLVPE